MVNPALLASIDQLESNDLDELIEYAASKRLGPVTISANDRNQLATRRHDADPSHWLTDTEFDEKLRARQ